VALNVIYHLRLYATKGAGRVQAHKLCPYRFPLARIATLAAVGASGVMAATSGAYSVALALTDHTSRDNCTARTKARRRGHYILDFNA
jgi:hypothetical protein